MDICGFCILEATFYSKKLKKCYDVNIMNTLQVNLLDAVGGAIC